MTFLSTRTRQMRPLSKRTIANDKNKNNANDVAKKRTVISTRTMQMMLLSTRTMQMRVLSSRTMAEDGDKHKNNDRRR